MNSAYPFVRRFALSHIIGPVAASFVLAAVASPALADDGVLLEPTWKVGKTYTCEHTQDVTITIGAGDQATENPITVAVTFDAAVTPHGDEGSKAISFETKKVKMTMSMFGIESTYDSEDADNQSEELGAMLEGILKRDDLKVIYDRNDEFVKFEEEGRRKPKAGGVGAAAMAPVKFGKTEIKQMLAYCVRSFPDRPIKKGDKWEADDKIQLSLGGADLKLAMNAEGPNEDDHPTITYESEFEATFEREGPGAGNKGEGNIVGKMVYDPEKAILSEHITTIEMSVNMGGLELPVTQRSKTTVVKIADTKE